MKQWTNISLVLGLWAIYVNATPIDQLPTNSAQDVCSMLTSLSKESQMLTKFNGVFFGDFKSSKNGGSQGPLAIGGSFTGENAFLNQRNQLTCAAETDSVFGHHGLILKGAINSSIKVNGFAHVANLSTSNTITVPLRECSVKTAVTDYDFEATRSNVLGMSRHMAGMFPNWTIDKQGVLVKVIAESAQHLVQPYNVFSLPAFCNSATCERKSYFDCTEDQACEIPSHALSDIDIMILGKGVWTGPLEQAFPKDEMIIFNIPVMGGETIDIRTMTPSADLNACNTIYNFYAVTQQGTYAPQGKFTIMRNSKNSLAGMIIAPQAHIIDGITGSFSGQVIADSYEAQGEGTKINDYISTGNEQCQAFTGCSTLKGTSKLGRRQAHKDFGFKKADPATETENTGSDNPSHSSNASGSSNAAEKDDDDDIDNDDSKV